MTNEPAPIDPEREGEGARGPARTRPARKAPFRVPEWVVVPLAALVGGFVGGVSGALFAGVLAAALVWVRARERRGSARRGGPGSRPGGRPPPPGRRPRSGGGPSSDD